MSSHPIKFESFDTSPQTSIADSFESSPGTNYPPIFDDSPRLHPLDAFTPNSFDDEYDESIDSTPAPEPEKKAPVKKRKSWGQQLPEPKTNLPPRKRAKTEDEKEQRRVERVLRNRRAAQSSRERKRLEVEALEKEKQSVTHKLRDMDRLLQESARQRQRDQAEINQLKQQLAAVTGDTSVFNRTNSTYNPNPNPEPLRSVRSPPITFSKELFGSQDSCISNMPSSNFSPLPSTTVTPIADHTVNPASLSPELQPVDQSNASSSGMTQHPAAMLCDLQCQPEEQQSWMASPGINSSTACLIALLIFMTTTISMALNPMIMVLHSLKTGATLTPTTPILSTIMWLATTASSRSTSTSLNSRTAITRDQGQKFGLRIRLLRRLLACSPQLARPLLDATLGAMRLVSEQQIVLDSLNDGLANVDSRGVGNSASLIILMTMAHSIKVIMKEQKHLGQRRSNKVEMGGVQADEFSEILGRYQLSFLSGIGDLGRRDLQKSLAEDKGRYGSRDWD